MILVQAAALSVLMLVTDVTARTYTSDLIADTGPVKYNASRTYGQEYNNQSGLASIFSPRMDFEQWKPLTGRGDPLRNDPTYDYEPPVLDRVHYWADETRLEKEHVPERKSEVLMLGVSSRKPSVTPRQPPWPPIPPKRHVPRPVFHKYENFAYKLSDDFPMTILVPPPPPPPGSQPPLFILSDGKPSVLNKIQQLIEASPGSSSKIKDSTATPEHLSSFYALQESNLIYQSSTTTQNWLTNETKSIVNNAVSSDYAGWGPTTPVDDSDMANETHNLISNDHIEYSKHPYLFYKPMLEETPATPPPKKISSPIVFTFYPTPLPATNLPETSTEFTQVTWDTERTTEVLEVPTEIAQDVTTEKENRIQDTTTPSTLLKPGTSVDMFRPMMTMPMVGGPERPEDNLYAHASENVQVFEEQSTEDIQMETMQTMQPPPPAKGPKSSMAIQKQQFHVNSQSAYKNAQIYTHGPYLHGRFTTPIPTTIDDFSDNFNYTTEAPSIPMYLIIQGHSKVKTYSSKLKVPESEDTILNEISKAMEKNEVKHLHPIIKQSIKKVDSSDGNRKGKVKNFKSLVEEGWGSIEMQEADVGIKYDISDGSDVPIEIYRKGIVDNDVNIYSSNKKLTRKMRAKRAIHGDLYHDPDDVSNYSITKKTFMKQDDEDDDDDDDYKTTHAIKIKQKNKRTKPHSDNDGIWSNFRKGKTNYQHNTKNRKINFKPQASKVNHFYDKYILPSTLEDEAIDPSTAKTTHKHEIKHTKLHFEDDDEVMPKKNYGRSSNQYNKKGVRKISKTKPAKAHELDNSLITNIDNDYTQPQSAMKTRTPKMKTKQETKRPKTPIDGSYILPTVDTKKSNRSRKKTTPKIKTTPEPTDFEITNTDDNTWRNLRKNLNNSKYSNKATQAINKIEPESKYVHYKNDDDLTSYIFNIGDLDYDLDIAEQENEST